MKPKAIFAAYSYHLSGQGGVQLCTNEFLAVLRKAGLEINVVPVEPDRRLSTRLWRRTFGSAYFRPLSAESIAAIQREGKGVQFLFLNQVALAGALPHAALSGVPTIALSHGCEITDLLHLARLRDKMPLSSNQLRPTARFALGRTLFDEALSRRNLDGVVAISPFDADCERWFGTRNVCWIPRTLAPNFLDPRPVMGRFGYVGTLDHSPNLEGLTGVLTAISATDSKELVVRIVGGPERVGRWLTQRFPHAEYLGPLQAAQLGDEVESWNGFIHPIFCLARGCSTKLASAIAWGLPVVTTHFGRRGYVWTQGSLLEANDPCTFAEAMQSLTRPNAYSEAATEVKKVAHSCPTKSEVAAQVTRFLGL
jgi:Glycosyl transferases group 1